MSIDEKALLGVKELMKYTGLGENRVRSLLRDPRSTFTIRVGNRLYANKKKFDQWLDQQSIVY